MFSEGLGSQASETSAATNKALHRISRIIEIRSLKYIFMLSDIFPLEMVKGISASSEKKIVANITETQKNQSQISKPCGTGFLESHA
jgi:hypothetical protein